MGLLSKFAECPRTFSENQFSLSNRMRREIGRILPPLRGRGEGDSEKEAGEGRLVGWREQNQDQGNTEIRAGKACLVAEQLCTIDDGLSFLVLVFLPVLPGTENVCFSCHLFTYDDRRYSRDSNPLLFYFTAL